MKRQIQLWGSRTLMLAALVFVVQRWGVPMYKQYFSPPKTSVFVPTAKVQVGKFTVSFHEIGTLDAQNSVSVYAEDNGKIITLVTEGTMVKVGDKIAEMDTSDLLREVRNQTMAVKNAEADVARADAEKVMLKLSNQTELDKQQADYDFNVNERDMAKKQLEKTKRLADEKLVPRDEVDQAELTLRSKELTVAKGVKDLELKKKDNESKERQKDSEVRKVSFACETQKSALAEMQTRVKSGLLLSPAVGMVVIAKTWGGAGDFRKLQEGDQIHHRQVICQLPDLTAMKVKVNVGESDAPKLKVGMTVLVRLEAIPDKVFHGTVNGIASLATESNPWESGSTPGRKNFEVTIFLKEADPKSLKPGMTADAEFICDAIEKTVFIPLESVIEKDGKTFVFVKNGKRWERTRIVTDKYNDNFIVIKKGIKKGQVIALRDPTRPMDEQESGAASPGNEEQKDKKEPAPMPVMPSAGAAKK